MLLRALIPLALIAPAIPTRVDPLTGMTIALIPAGSFNMGTPASEPQRARQERLHRVTLTRAFYLAVHEVTATVDKGDGAEPVALSALR